MPRASSGIHLEASSLMYLVSELWWLKGWAQRICQPEGLHRPPCGWSFSENHSWLPRGRVHEGALESRRSARQKSHRSLVSFLRHSVGYKQLTKANLDAQGKAMTLLSDCGVWGLRYRRTCGVGRTAASILESIVHLRNHSRIASTSLSVPFLFSLSLSLNTVVGFSEVLKAL